jgi:hypothetical protein
LVEDTVKEVEEAECEPKATATLASAEAAEVQEQPASQSVAENKPAAVVQSCTSTKKRSLAEISGGVELIETTSKKSFKREGGSQAPSKLSKAVEAITEELANVTIEAPANATEALMASDQLNPTEAVFEEAVPVEEAAAVDETVVISVDKAPALSEPVVASTAEAGQAESEITEKSVPPVEVKSAVEVDGKSAPETNDTAGTTVEPLPASEDQSLSSESAADASIDVAP